MREENRKKVKEEEIKNVYNIRNDEKIEIRLRERGGGEIQCVV